MKNKRILYFLSIILLLGMGACNSSQDENQLIDDDSLIEEKVETENTIQQFFQLPSPVELFMFMWEDGAPFNAANLNAFDRADVYVETKAKALNLGVYSADLAYCTVYDKNKETMNLFSATKTLAEDLGLTEGFDQSILDRIDRNIENSDSLYHITSDSYSKTITFLQSQGQTKLLPYIIYGGWIESVYIATQTVKKYNPESEIAVRIADQGLLLENLIEFFQTIQAEDKEATAVLIDLNALDQLFKKSLDTEDGLMSKEIYGEIKTKVKSLRQTIVK
jgi:hypothetical protein